MNYNRSNMLHMREPVGSTGVTNPRLQNQQRSDVLIPSYWGVSRRPLIWTPICRETPVSQIFVQMLAVDITVWDRVLLTNIHNHFQIIVITIISIIFFFNNYSYQLQFPYTNAGYTCPSRTIQLGDKSIGEI